MSSFEYVMVIVSIIMGLGITTLLRGTVNMLRADSGWKPSGLHSLWVVNLLVMHVGLWSLRWSGVRRDEWPFAVLLAYLFMPILLYVLAELLFPRSEAEVDLSDYFVSNRRLFFFLMVLTIAASVIGPFIFYGGVDPLGGAWGPAIVLSLVPVAIAAVYGVFAHLSNRSLHTIWAAANLVILLLVFAVLAVG